MPSVPLSPQGVGVMANALRMLSAETVERAGSGHPGMPLGMADVMTVLYTGYLKFEATCPDWADRDRLILSAGHGSALLYALLYLNGYPGMELDELKRFRRLGSLTPGHPEYRPTSGVEATTGPLGQGLANAVGMAIAERILNARFGDELVDHRTYAVVSDGDLMEGVASEAIALAGHLRLRRLVVLWDDNRITIDGDTWLARSEDVLAHLRASQWEVRQANGHDLESISQALSGIYDCEGPLFIACRTTIGFGAASKAGSASAHGAPLGAAEMAELRKNLGWKPESFATPDYLLGRWRKNGQRGKAQRLQWEQRLQECELSCEFNRTFQGCLPQQWNASLNEYKHQVLVAGAAGANISTRRASQMSLERLTRELPELVGGSADLGRSTLAHSSASKPLRPADYQGNYIHYGVREFAMAGIMSGLALHKGIIPYGGTFLAFSDYMRGAIRLAAMMGLRVIFVLTHDSIALGEDGPTHQPVEHLASLRAIPNLRVFRPADAAETAECWELAVSRDDGPSVLVLSRQQVAVVRVASFGADQREANLCARGAYVLRGAKGRQVTLIATGSEVAIACRARELLAQINIQAAVVSMPCWEYFKQQPPDYQLEVLRPDLPRVAVEAASPLGWSDWVGENGLVIAIDGFGASAQGDELLAHFGFTPQIIADKVRAHLTRVVPDQRPGDSHNRQSKEGAIGDSSL